VAKEWETWFWATWPGKSEFIHWPKA
jgi:hypothetical protein